MKSLDRAYRTRDTILLDSIFTKWNNTIRSNEELIDSNKLLKEVYDIFNEFYTPHDLKRITSEKFTNSKKEKKYSLIQDYIIYAELEFPKRTINQSSKDLNRYFDKLNFEKTIKDSIKQYTEEFKPHTQLNHDKVLYLTQEYYQSILKYLKIKEKKDMFDIARYSKSTYKRINFLSDYIKMSYAHWTGDLYLDTDLYVNLIVVDSRIEKSVLYFRYGSRGGKAYLEKENNEWSLIKSKLTWIE